MTHQCNDADDARVRSEPSPGSGPGRDERAEDRGEREEWSGEGCFRRRREGRKERVLHTRVSEQLSDEIRQLADDLRVPVSNLVRNVLEEVFTMVESVSDDMGGLFEDILDEAEDARERIRRRARRSRRRRGPRQRHHLRHRRRDASFDGSDESVEQELRRDEAEEASRAESELDRPESSDRERRQRPEFPEVIGWQPLVLNRQQTCASCGIDLPRGVRAFIGIGEQGMTRTTLCRACGGMG